MGDVCRASDRRWKEEGKGRLRSNGKGLKGIDGTIQFQGSSHPP